jgi:5-deoxy-glucuronate isomerase
MDMHQYDEKNLVVRSGNSPDPDVLVMVSPENAGWDTIHFQVRRLAAGESWSFSTELNELALVVLSGTVTVATNQNRWTGLGKRENVFAGLPYALYLPIHTQFTVTAESNSEYALAWAAAEQHFPARLITPADIGVEIRGGDNATRQINSLLPPGFPCARLVVVEVCTPGGNWSSYPPHKHDIHKDGPDGKVLEADLDEIYYYKIDRPEGYAFQRIYTDPESPLHAAGYPIDTVVMPRSNDVVLIPEGYHPVTSPPGYTTYYLNILAGSAQSLAATDDPQYSWVKNAYQQQDTRVPIYDISQSSKQKA